MSMQSSGGASTSPVQGQRTFLGHPLGLYVLFFTEMWERFNYYGMRALLMLYMVNYFRWSQKDASIVYKVFTSFVYVTPILGGYLADRWIGNKWAVVIGAILMAFGQFLMAFDVYEVFLAALVFLIIGNGFFKPNMSTQVGRLYPTNDGRRDGAYTIFYMGINLGAFLAPVACGWVAENTVGGYHSGFVLAGIGMLAGLLIYVLGQPLIQEIDPATQAVNPVQSAGAPASTALTEREASQAPSVLGSLASLMPALLTALGGLMFLAGVVCTGLEIIKRSGTDVPTPVELWNAVMLAIGGGCLVLLAYVCRQVQGGMLDRVLAILILGIFVIFFWGAFEQAGNVLNIWADKNTDRYLTQEAPPPDVVPAVVEDAPKGEEGTRPAATGILERFLTLFRLKPSDKPSRSWSDWLTGSINPVPTPWFQSINALAIFVLAPFFAWLWIALDRRGWQPSIPVKMTLGLLLMSAAMAVMVAAANRENQASSVRLRGVELPALLALTDADQPALKKDGTLEPLHAGRLTYDRATQTLHVRGVLPDTEANRIIEATAPASFRKKVEELKEASAKIDGENVKSVSVRLEGEPPGFAMKYAGLKKSVVQYDPPTHTLTAYQTLADKEVKALLVAAGEPDFRTTIHELHVASNTFRVSWAWLFWSYVLATLGELCLSPVGLSMVSKLAPAKFATMLMGVWMLTASFGNFAAGALGEVWGTIPPVQFFAIATAVVGGAAVVLFLLARKVVAMMHGVN